MGDELKVADIVTFSPASSGTYIRFIESNVSLTDSEWFTFTGIPEVKAIIDANTSYSTAITYKKLEPLAYMFSLTKPEPDPFEGSDFTGEI